MAAKSLPDTRWSFPFASVVLSRGIIVVDSQVKSKDLEKLHKDEYRTLSKEAQAVLDRVFQKKKQREESISPELQVELYEFFSRIAVADGIQGENIGEDYQESESFGFPGSPGAMQEETPAGRDTGQDVMQTSPDIKEYDEDESLDSKFVVKVEERLKFHGDPQGNAVEANVDGALVLENNGEKEQVWDIDIHLEGIESTSLEDPDVHVSELGPGKEWRQEYSVEIEGEPPLYLSIEEVLDTSIDTEEKSEVFILDKESDGVPTNFSIFLKNISSVPVHGIQLVKELPDDFKDASVVSVEPGEATLEGNVVKWSLETLEAGERAILDLRFTVYPTEIKVIKSAPVRLSHEVRDATFSGVQPAMVDGLCNHLYLVDRDEREEEPDVWDCQLVFKNRSEFPILLKKLEVISGDENTEYETVALEPNVVIPPASSWSTEKWEVKSADEPTFSEKIEFTVLARTESSIIVEQVQESLDIPVLSISGEKTFDTYELPSYREGTVSASIVVTTEGSILVERMELEDTIPPNFLLPDKEDISIKIAGNDITGFEIEQDPPGAGEDVERKMRIVIGNYDETYGELKAGSEIRTEYRMRVKRPPKGAVYEAPAVFRLVTKPSGKALEAHMEPEMSITVVHHRRRTRVGKAIVPLPEENTYEVVLIYKNKSDVQKNDVKISDFIPADFSVLESNMDHESTGRDDGTLLTWNLEEVAPGQEVEITYKIHGEGDAYSLKNIETKAFK